jgi:ribosomal protein S18 acetylase RimI-like enzyme
MRHQPISPASPAGLSQPSPRGGRIVQNQIVLVSVTESAADAMNNVAMRPAAAADVEWLTAVFLGSLREAITAARGTWDEVRESVQFREQLDLASTRIIDLDGRAVGFFMSPARDTDVELHTLCIAPECQSQGVGTYIARGLISDARASGRGVVLSVLKVNERARTFYARLGFVVAQESKHHYRMRLG